MQQFAELKCGHVDIMIKVCTYLQFDSMLTLTKVNRRLYFVTGNMPLLLKFTKTKEAQE